MTDPDLVRRAEQAYLGALLARQGRAGTGTAVAGDAGPDAFAGLHPLDFTDPVHQAIYAALAAQAAPGPRVLAGLYERLRGLLSRLLRTRAREAGAYMAGLPGMCPDPAHLPAYAAMIAEASQLRAAAAPAPDPGPQRTAAQNARRASAAGWLDGTGRGAGPAPRRRPAPAAPEVPAPRTGRMAGDLAPDVARLSRALRADARRAAPGTAPGMPPESRPAPLSAEALQEQVLADLMRRPADGRDLVSWLPDTVFTAGPNRSLYQLIGGRIAHGRPVDPLIIAWDASPPRDPGSTAATPGTAKIETLAAAALRLGTLDPAPGTAATLARALYAEQVCTGTFGPDWPTEPGYIPASAEPADSSQQPEPGGPWQWSVPGGPSQWPEPAGPSQWPEPAGPSQWPEPAGPSQRQPEPGGAWRWPEPADPSQRSESADPSQWPEPGPSAAGQAVVSTIDQPAPSAAPAAETDEAETASAGRTGTAPPADRHPVPVLPRRVPSPLFQPPPAPGPATPAPVPRQ